MVPAAGFRLDEVEVKRLNREWRRATEVRLGLDREDAVTASVSTRWGPAEVLLEPGLMPLVARVDAFEQGVRARRAASVNGRESEGNVVEVDAPELPRGQVRANNVRVRVRAETRIAEPLAPLLAPAIPQEPQSPE